MLYLVRHGLAAAGVDDLDPGLSEAGRAQALLTARALDSVGAGRLVVSPLRRTRETAAPLVEALGLEAELRDEVAEVFDPSMPADERAAMIGPFMAGRWTEQPGALRAWRERVVETLLAIGLEAAQLNRPAIVVSHYIAIGVGIGEALGDDRVVPIRIANCSITSLDAGHGGLRLVEAASVAHLPPELITGVAQALPGLRPPGA